MKIRNDWTKSEISEIYKMPLINLISKANRIHEQYKKIGEVQVCKLLSVKTGGCPEDCSYCPQSVKYNTNLKVEPLMKVDEVVKAAKRAKEEGNTRFCMGAAWREIRDNRDFDKVLEMVTKVSNMGLEVCCTMGMLTDQQAAKLKDAGLDAYNHNLDTGDEYYDKIISTRNYDNRLKTIKNVQKNKISVCSGGIIGMGEKEKDRIDMLYTLSNLQEHPESVPVNALVPIEGTPLEEQPKVPIWDVIRMIATARIIMPLSQVRLSAGRISMNYTEQALCFLAGASSIFSGDKLLTSPNNSSQSDEELFNILGLIAQKPNKKEKQEA